MWLRKWNEKVFRFCSWMDDLFYMQVKATWLSQENSLGPNVKSGSYTLECKIFKRKKGRNVTGKSAGFKYGKKKVDSPLPDRWLFRRKPFRLSLAPPIVSWQRHFPPIFARKSIFSYLHSWPNEIGTSKSNLLPFSRQIGSKFIIRLVSTNMRIRSLDVGPSKMV